MTNLRALSLLPVLLVAALGSPAQEQPVVEIEKLTPDTYVYYDLRTGTATATNGVVVKYGNAVLVAQRWVQVDLNSGEVVADGDVRIQRDEMVWVGEHIRYNFKTRQMQAEQFRTGHAPVFVAGRGLHGDLTNRLYYGTNAFVTTDDVAQPFQKIRARSIKIVPGQYVQARHATLYLGDVPVFYFPYYARKLGARANHFYFVPGYRSRYGPYLLSSYTWFLNEHLDATLHADYRARRGVGAGADANYQFGRWGEGNLKSYYLHDAQPETDDTGVRYPANRQVVWFDYQSMPFTNLSVKAAARYQSDAGVLREFFERLYRRDPQAATFFDLNQFWQNFSLDVYAQPRVNGFLETVERLPQVTLTGYRQQLSALPVFYESESSFGYFQRRFAETNGLFPNDFAAVRGDTHHQLLLPQTLFGWLTVTPRAGGRFTYYGEANGAGAKTAERYRGVFDTGVEVSFKVSRLWPGVQSRFLQVNGLRHILEPSVNYVYVPVPNARPASLPQFDYETASLRLLPIDFPDYAAIDSIDSQNVARVGLRNKLQTKRENGVENLLEWEVFTDWRLRPQRDQRPFSDIYSALTLRPRSWLTLESEDRFDLDRNQLNLARQTVLLQPSSTWSWGMTYYYLRADLRPSPTAWGPGSHVFSSSMYYRVNENWGLRASHYFDVNTSRLAEQAYSLYRDFRSWTAAVILRLRDLGNGREDFAIGFTVSLKAFPRYSLGTDTAGQYGIPGY